MYIDRFENNKYLLRFCSVLSLLAITIIIAFRGPIDNDYFEYVRFFDESNKILDIIFGGESLLRNSDHLYFIIISSFKQLDLGFISFLFFTTLISILLKYLAARGFCSISNSFLAVLLWLSLNAFTYEAMQIRYALAMGVCAYSLTLKSTRLQIFTFTLGFMIHMGIFFVALVFIINIFGINHRKIIRNTICLIFLFLIGRNVDYSFIPNMLSIFNFSTLEYLSGKLIGYLNQQDNTLSLITVSRLLILYSLYVISVKSNCNDKVLNITFSFFVIISVFSSFSVFFGRILPLVEFFSIIAFFCSVKPRIKQTVFSSYILFILSLTCAATFFYLAIISGSFNLS